MQIEQVVKNHVDFRGEYRRQGVHSKSKSRLQLPLGLSNILRERHGLSRNDKVTLFYRFHLQEIPQYLELTDIVEPQDSALYTPCNVDKKMRFVVNKHGIDGMQIGNPNRIIYVGKTNRILVYREHDYDAIIGRRREHPTYRQTAHPTL